MNEKQGIFDLSYRYSRALYRWLKAGRPARSEEEIKQIFETHCLTCEAYEEGSSSCRYCGCRVNRLTVPPLNKIAMATEECPVEKWGE
jgi:hypothetical protein